ncbi:MAG: glycoside hydrolase family 31 protein [Verrucomicrobiota bacterium]|nr:glycoside hydrolase family 31 protein [Verrucomicrobiota bacterium]
MYFHKISNPINFSFPQKPLTSSGKLTVNGRTFAVSARNIGSDVFRIEYNNPQWKFHSQAGLTKSLGKKNGQFSLDLTRDGGFALRDARNKIVLRTRARQPFGLCGKSWMVQLDVVPGAQFYGMGEKNNGFEKSGVKSKFWNTDVWMDFSFCAVESGVTDPMYVSVPYLIIKTGNEYMGLLIDNPYACYMSIPPSKSIPNQKDVVESSPLAFGSDEGLPVFYILTGPTLADLTRKLQKLVGVTPMPPLWALGHHQCRWGYAGPKDLNWLDGEFSKHKIPTDGLWLDIDYMEGYRVFTFASKHWKNPRKEIKFLTDRNRHIIPIIDPGVKHEKGYSVYDDGSKAGAWCRNPEGGIFIGYVWPGETAFPDFSLPEVRAWWAKHVEQFARLGFSGAWLDMNDPAVGSAELDPMLFNRGKNPHGSYHNQYALGMQMASRDGFMAAHPGKRPFLLSRSGFTGSSKHAAIWTGDNVSNWHHLKGSIPMSLNLALSGIPFNGPDVPGFGGSPDEELAVAWYKAGFLFPFFRNHTHIGCAQQEPWAFGKKPMLTIRHLIRLRYKLLPYIYNLFIKQEQSGDAIMRPLFHDFEDTATLPLGKIDDQFMVGPFIMHAPIVKKGESSREVTLPKGGWFAAHENKWINGGRIITTKQSKTTTLLYIREGAIIPMQRGVRTDNANDLTRIELHLFLQKSTRGKYTIEYSFDDGATFDYTKGKRSTVQFTAQVRNGRLCVEVDTLAHGYGDCEFECVTYDPALRDVTITGGHDELTVQAKGWKFF